MWTSLASCGGSGARTDNLYCIECPVATIALVLSEFCLIFFSFGEEEDQDEENADAPCKEPGIALVKSGGAKGARTPLRIEQCCFQTDKG